MITAEETGTKPQEKDVESTAHERKAATVRKDHVTSMTSRATVHGAAFSVCQNPAFIGETEGSAAPV
jgi:hypothetical protein